MDGVWANDEDKDAKACASLREVFRPKTVWNTKLKDAMEEENKLLKELVKVIRRSGQTGYEYLQEGVDLFVQTKIRPWSIIIDTLLHNKLSKSSKGSQTLVRFKSTNFNNILEKIYQIGVQSFGTTMFENAIMMSQAQPSEFERRSNTEPNYIRRRMRLNADVLQHLNYEETQLQINMYDNEEHKSCYTRTGYATMYCNIKHECESLVQLLEEHTRFLNEKPWLDPIYWKQLYDSYYRAPETEFEVKPIMISAPTGNFHQEQDEDDDDRSKVWQAQAHPYQEPLDVDMITGRLHTASLHPPYHGLSSFRPATQPSFSAQHAAAIQPSFSAQHAAAIQPSFSASYAAATQPSFSTQHAAAIYASQHAVSSHKPLSSHHHSSSLQRMASQHGSQQHIDHSLSYAAQVRQSHPSATNSFSSIPTWFDDYQHASKKNKMDISNLM